MLVIYRMTSISSSNLPPVLAEDKNALNELCLKSFVKAFEDVQPKVIFLLDNCTCKEMVKKVCTFPFEIIESNIGINETMLRSYALASQFDDFVLFEECDHYWLPDTGKTMLEAIRKFGLVSGYDHPDFYSRFDIHPKETEIKLCRNHHFRKSARNVMSFGCHTSLVKENIEILNKYGYLDDLVWADLRQKGHDLWTALPALSTHMVKDYLAPGVPWNFQ